MSKEMTKDGGTKSKGAVNAAIQKFGKIKGKLSPGKRKKVAARLKSLKQQHGMKGTLKGE